MEQMPLKKKVAKPALRRRVLCCSMMFLDFSRKGLFLHETTILPQRNRILPQKRKKKGWTLVHPFFQGLLDAIFTLPWSRAFQRERQERRA